MNTVLFTVENHIATVTLNRPEALNALNWEMRQDLAEAWKRVNEDEEIRVGVVTGTGRAFCSGMDLKEAAQRIQRGQQGTFGGGTNPGGSYAAMQVYKPLIAAVNGPAAGGGFGIVLSCDIILAAESALFSAPYVARGTMDATTFALLMKKAPVGWAMWIALSAVRMDAQTALRIGLVNEVLPQGELLDRAYEMAERLVGNSYVSILAAKEKMRQVMEGTMKEALTVDGPFAKAYIEQSESKEGITAFTEKRQAQFG